LAAPASDPPEEDDEEELADEDREDILFRGISVTLREFRVESNKKPCGFPVFEGRRTNILLNLIKRLFKKTCSRLFDVKKHFLMSFLKTFFKQTKLVV
jgi:hypothetical protein